MFFKVASNLEKRLEVCSSVRLTTLSLGAAFVTVAAFSLAPDEVKYTVANMGGIVAGSLVILRQAGMKNAEAMKKLNVSKSSAACVQYGLMGNWSGVFTNLTSIGINQLYLSLHGKSIPQNFSILGRSINSNLAIATGGAMISTTLSVPFIAHVYQMGAESSTAYGMAQAAIHTLPLAANFLGIAAAAQPQGRDHRLLMGGAGGTSIGYDILTNSYGMLLSSIGSTAGTVIGWYKHDRQQAAPKAP